MIWYIAKDGQPKEMSEEVLIYKILNQEIPPDTLVANEEIKDWIPVKDTILYRQYAPSNRVHSVLEKQSKNNSRQKIKKWAVLFVVLVAVIAGIAGIMLFRSKKNIDSVVGTWTNGNANYTFEEDGNGVLTNDYGGYAGFKWEAYDADEGYLTILSSGMVDYWHVSDDTLYISVGGEYNPIAFTRVRNNQGNNGWDYKTAIEEHMKTIHGLSINTYENVYLWDDGSADAVVKVTVSIEDGLGSMDMSIDLHLDKEHQINDCSLCDLGVGYNGGGEKLEESSTIYKEFVIRKTEALTGFDISVELENYQEREITENGHTYIDVVAFINIEEMVGEKINTPDVFQLYALINPDNKEDLFLLITGNATGEIYRYDNTSIPHESANMENNATSDYSTPPTFESVPSYSENSNGIQEDIASQQSTGQDTDIKVKYEKCLAVDNGWIYYQGHGGLCRMKTDGSSKQLLCDGVYYTDICIKDDWIYYSGGIYRIKTDGSNRQKICDEAMVTGKFTVDQDWIYYSAEDWIGESGRGIYRIKIDGSGKERLLDDCWSSDTLVVAGEWLYLGRDFHRVKTDGTDLQPLIDYVFGIDYITVVDDWVYYYNGNDEKIWKVKTDGTQNQKVTKVAANDPPVERESYFIIEDDWIYYLRKLYDEVETKLCRMKTDGTESQVYIDVQIDEGWGAGGICEFWKEGDWIFYEVVNHSTETFSLFRMKTDGSQKQLLGGKNPAHIQFYRYKGQTANSNNKEEAALDWTFTESAPDLDIVGHYTDDWGFPVSFTIYVESGTVKDFCIVSFDWAEDSEDGIMFGVDRILQNIGNLTAGQGVVIEACLGEILPGTGFAYTDQDGSTHVYSFAESGEDGSIHITEDMIRQEY